MEQKLSFNDLPSAVNQLTQKVDNLQRLLLENTNQNHTEKDVWFDLNELLAYLPDKPTKPTVYGWVHELKIPFYKKGKKLYFLKSEIDQWLKTAKRKTNTDIEAEANAYLNNKK